MTKGATGIKIKLSQKGGQGKNPRKVQKLRPTKLRKSITPGTIVILLAGQFRGKRAVVVKQLEKSGKVLVTGPYKFNGVPLRRVDQRSLIATSTKVAGVQGAAASVSDALFARTDNKSKDFGAKDAKKPELSAERKKAQADVDAKVAGAISKDKEAAVLKKYLKTKFALTNTMNAHELSF